MSQIARNDPRDWGSTTNSAAVAVVPIQLIALNPPEPIMADSETPNDVTIQAMKDVRAGKNLIRCDSVDDMFRKLGI